MTIYTALTQDHNKVKDILNQLVSLQPGEKAKHGPLIEQLRDELIPHSRAEESVFYNSLRLIDASKKVAMHGYSEHMAAETLLRTLQMKDMVDADWLSTAKELKAALEHHIQEEETEMYSAAQVLFTQQEAEAMAEAFEKMKPEIRNEGFMGTTIDMLANLMPPRFTDAFTSNLRSQK